MVKQFSAGAVIYRVENDESRSYLLLQYPGKYWDFYDHHLGLTHLSLIEVLKLKGFDIEVCIDKFLPYTTKGLLPTHPCLVQIYLYFPNIVYKYT